MSAGDFHTITGDDWRRSLARARARRASARDGLLPSLGDGERDPSRLCLALTFHWFDETERGGKRIEYREMTDRWRKQIWDKRDVIKSVRFYRGYTARTLSFSVDKIDIGSCPISGWDSIYYRIHFSDTASNTEVSRGA